MTAHTSPPTTLALLGAAAIAVGLLSSGPAVAAPESTPPVGTDAASAPFLGANLSTMLTRDKVGKGGGADYDWDAAAQTLDQDLGVEVVRAGVYCSDPTIVEEYPAFSPFGCTSDKADDLDVVSRLIAEDGLTVAPLIQINWQSSQSDDEPLFDEALRDDYYAAFGRHIGQSLAAEVASGAVPYFELGNEPDLACIVSGTRGGPSPATSTADASIARGRASSPCSRASGTAWPRRSVWEMPRPERSHGSPSASRASDGG